MRKKSPNRRVVRKTTRKKSSFLQLYGRVISAILFLLFIAGVTYHYRNGIAYYLGFKSDKVSQKSKEADKRFSDVRNFELLEKYDDKVAGIDVSEYQGRINWEKVKYIENTFPVRFVFIRATAGNNRVDKRFETNWAEAKNHQFIRGAYHYYRPNENSREQANNFIKTVQLRKGDLPPVLDIEKLPKNQPMDSLKAGLRRWLTIVDAHYKVKPIIYTGERYYDDFLKDEFSDYSFWIANYNFFTENIQDDWLFWQFTERGTLTGIKGNVDVNIYNGTPKMLQYLTIGN